MSLFKKLLDLFKFPASWLVFLMVFVYRSNIPTYSVSGSRLLAEQLLIPPPSPTPEGVHKHLGYSWHEWLKTVAPVQLALTLHAVSHLSLQ